MTFVETVSAIMTALGVIGTAARAIPTETWQRWEQDVPRAANALRLARALGPDVVKAARVVWAIVRGTPWGRSVAHVVDPVLRPPSVPPAAKGGA